MRCFVLYVVILVAYREWKNEPLVTDSPVAARQEPAISTASVSQDVPDEGTQARRLEEPTQEDRLALESAIESWKRALDDAQIPTPALYRGSGFCDKDALACASPSTGTIIIVNVKDYDEVTVLTHEVAHLLGVPHIEGDPLMDQHYQRKLDGPSPFAVAIAKAAQ